MSIRNPRSRSHSATKWGDITVQYGTMSRQSRRFSKPPILVARVSLSCSEVLSGDLWSSQLQRFANSSCPVCTHTLSFVFNKLHRSHLRRKYLICRLKCIESAPYCLSKLGNLPAPRLLHSKDQSRWAHFVTVLPLPSALPITFMRFTPIIATCRDSFVVSHFRMRNSEASFFWTCIALCSSSASSVFKTETTQIQPSKVKSVRLSTECFNLS